MTSLLQFRGISKSYGKTLAVSNVTLSIEKGEFVVLLGPSGCGKTTTLRMLAGFVTPSRGTIELNGKIISGPDFAVPPEKRNMGMVFQSYAIWPHMTVAQNVAYGLESQRRPRSEARQTVDRLLKSVQLEGLGSRYPNELSGGQQQRVAFARALAVNPQVLLMDEPLSNLDAKLREEMRDELRRLHQELRFTAVYVTHDQVEAISLADRVVVMNAGEIQQSGPPHILYRRPRNEFVARFLGDTNVLIGSIVRPGIAKVGSRCFEVESSASIGSSVALVWRPNAIAVLTERSVLDSIDAIVERVTNLGASKKCYVAVKDLEASLLVSVNSYLDIVPGQQVHLELIAPPVALEGPAATSG